MTFKFILMYRPPTIFSNFSIVGEAHQKITSYGNQYFKNRHRRKLRVPNCLLQPLPVCHSSAVPTHVSAQWAPPCCTRLAAPRDFIMLVARCSCAAAGSLRSSPSAMPFPAVKQMRNCKWDAKRLYFSSSFPFPVGFTYCKAAQRCMNWEREGVG